MVAEFGQQFWLCTNFRCSDRTLRSRDRILDFSQEMVKTSAGTENLTSTEVLTSRAGTTGRYSTRETPPIKAERPEPSDHLRSTFTRGNTIYEDLNESLQPDLEEVSSWRFCRAQIVRGAEFFCMNFDRRGNFRGAAFCWHRDFTRRGDFNVRLSSIVYCQAHGFCIPQKFSAIVFRRSFPQ